MTPRRLALLAVVAAVLVVAGVAALRARRAMPAAPRDPGAAAPAGAADGPVEATGGAALATPAAAIGPSTGPRIATGAHGGRPSARADVPWPDVPLSTRLSDLGPALAGPVGRALDEARAHLEPCFEAEARALATAPPPPVDPDDPPTSAAVLVLHLESRVGGLELVGTELRTLGSSTPALVACCREAIRGWSIDAPGAAPGRRYRLSYLLQ